jgi:hypothetical protein
MTAQLGVSGKCGERQASISAISASTGHVNGHGSGARILHLILKDSFLCAL